MVHLPGKNCVWQKLVIDSVIQKHHLGWNKCVSRQIPKPRNLHLICIYKVASHPIPGHCLSKPGKKKSGEDARMFLVCGACSFSNALIGRNCNFPVNKCELGHNCFPG